MPRKLRRDVVEDSVDNCIENTWAEDELARWMTKQTVRCLRRRDEARTS